MNEQPDPSIDARLVRIETKVESMEQSVIRLDSAIARLMNNVDSTFRWVLGAISGGVTLILSALYFTAQYLR